MDVAVKTKALMRNPDAVARLNEILERCRVISQERTAVVRTDQRVSWIGAALNPLLSAQPPEAASEEEMRGLLALAFAGWTWRAAELGDVDSLADAIRAAYAAVEADERCPRDNVVTWAAWRFLADGGEPGLGTPGGSDAERIACLEAAFEKFHETYGKPAGIETARAREAFRHGVALFDVERVVGGLASSLAPR